MMPRDPAPTRSPLGLGCSNSVRGSVLFAFGCLNDLFIKMPGSNVFAWSAKPWYPPRP